MVWFDFPNELLRFNTGVVLQCAPQVTGPWTDMSSTSPYVRPLDTQEFFRLEFQRASGLQATPPSVSHFRHGNPGVFRRFWTSSQP